MIPLFKAAIAPQAYDLVADVMRSGILGHGPRVDEFEDALREHIGNPHLATVNNATSGLHLAMRLATDPGPGHDRTPGEVLTTPYTFEAMNWAALANDLRIRWVDVDPATLNVDLDDLAKKITPATRAVVVVHWGGYPVDLDRLGAILDDAQAAHGVRPMVVEDCAHAWAATYRGRPLGNHGNVCVYSFHAIKHLTTGTGGMMVLPDADTRERICRLRWFGIDRRADRVNADYDVPEYGYNFYLNEIGGAIGLANLRRVGELVQRHRDNAAFYDAELAGVDGIELTERADDREPSFWLYPVKVADRAGLMRKLAGAGIMSSAVIRRNDAHSCVERFADPDLPGVTEVAGTVVNIPVGWWLSPEDRAHIAATIRSGW